MGGAKSLLGMMPGMARAAAAGDGTRAPLDEALKKLEGRGPFMSKLVARLRARSAAAAPGATTVGGTPGALGTAAAAGASAFQPLRGGFMGGY